ncbi:hypothetical protein ACFU7T_25860 [Streptomyces sp. NPDC057555]|uniref:hypothetical protein n=1 Tax=Streptomyces sp. NPDC057555 TaxID=3346166 RepID=UPI0036A149E8
MQTTRHCRGASGDSGSQLTHPSAPSHRDHARITAMLHQAGFTGVTVHGGYRADTAPTAADNVWTFEATRT